MSANIRPASGGNFLEKEHLFSVGGLKVGVTGVTAPGLLQDARGAEESSTAAAAWTADDPAEALRSVVPGLRRRADVVVLLAHMNAHEAKLLVEGVPGIDVVIVGHHPAPGYAGEKWGSASVLRTGQKGQLAPMITLMAGGDTVSVVDTVFKPLAPGDPFVADMQTEIDLFESEIKSLREKAPRPDRTNPPASGRTPTLEEARERSSSGDR